MGNRRAAAPGLQPGDPQEPERGPEIHRKKFQIGFFCMTELAMTEQCVDKYLDGSNGLLAGHLEGVSILGTQEELHLDAGREYKNNVDGTDSVSQ